MTPESLRDRTILLVDDEEANVDLLEAFLGADGYRSLVRTSDAREVIPLFEAHRPDLVLLDLHMPHRTGFQLLADIRARTAPGEYLPVLVLTADVTPAAKERALGGGARDFLTKPFDMVEVLLRVRNLLETRELHRLERRARERAEAEHARSALLAEASRVLGASLDDGTTLEQLARLLAPRWAEGCVVLLDEGGRWVPAAAAHADPAAAPALAAAAAAAVARVDGAAPGDVAAPLQTQGRLLGWLYLTRGGPRPPFAPEDAALARELAARAALALENARLFASAEWATRARERMLSVVAHDLRNPLAVVAMYSEMLLSMLPPGGDAYQEEALRSIFQCTERMQRLIEDLLDVSRLQQGAFALERIPQALAPLLREAERMLRPLAEARGIELRVDAPGSLAVEVDGARVLQVLSNLVGNALKFTPVGGRVRVACRGLDGAVQVSVADSGPGITASQLPQIFGAFWQAQGADRRGVGLGLWIARAVVEAHGGRIWVESEEGRGAVFHFTLPAGVDAAPAAAAPWVG